MSRIALALLLIAACGGGDDGGGGEDGGGGADGAPEVDGGGGDDGPRDQVEGQISIDEAVFGADGYDSSWVAASILEPRPQYMAIAMEMGDCRMWRYQPADCGACDGLCDADGDCVPFPVPLSAGNITVSGIQGGDVTLRPSEYGYTVDNPPPVDLYAPGDGVASAAEGGDDVAAFSLAAEGVDPIGIDLVDGGGGEQDTLRMVDGGDLVVSWDPARPGTRVRLEIDSNNQGHGLPVTSMIECESDDDGSLIVPRAMVEAFPEKPYQNICVAIDCPPSSLTRYRWDRADVSGLAVELRVEFRRYFLVVHEP